MSEEPEATDSAEGALSVLSDTLGDLITGVPAPIRKNAFAAFGRLCTAAVNYPVTLIEGAAAERRAESKARVRLINTSASQIAKQMRTDPEYARAAVTKFAHKIIRERVNLDQISEIAADDLKSEPLTTGAEQPEAPPISEDWLNAFESEAAQMSSEQMQRLFGKILAGEIRRPASYSIKTLRLMAQVDNRAAALFSLLCSLSISSRVPDSNIIIDARVVSLGRHAGSNSLQAYDLGFDALNILQEYGLIISDYNSYMDYRMAVSYEGRIPLPMIHQKAKWGFIPKVARQVSEDFRVHGVGFSQSGKELLSIVDIQPNEPYSAALQKFFDDQGMTMTNVG
jgi:hypothetical protein